MKYQLLTLLLILILSASCTPTSTEALETVPVFPTWTKTILPSLPPNSSSPSTPTPTERATITPTRTPNPSATSTEAPYYTPTIPRETLAALATLDSLVTQIPSLGEFYSWDRILYPHYTSGLGLSPNGLWAAFFSARDSGGLKIVSVDGTKLWEVYYSELSGMTCPCGDALVEIDHWSADGKYIYLNPDMRGDGGLDWVWRKEAHLIRLDLFSGYWIDTQMGNSYSFSPDDHFIAYRSESGIHIHNLSTGQESVFSVSAEFIDFGRFVFSPDSSRIVYIAAKDLLPEEVGEPGLTVFLLDLKEGVVEILFEDDTRYLYPIAWPEQSFIIFETLYEWQTYRFDLETGEISPVAWPVTR
jgi:hypothetical protein